MASPCKMCRPPPQACRLQPAQWPAPQRAVPKVYHVPRRLIMPALCNLLPLQGAAFWASCDPLDGASACKTGSTCTDIGASYGQPSEYYCIVSGGGRWAEMGGGLCRAAPGATRCQVASRHCLPASSLARAGGLPLSGQWMAAISVLPPPSPATVTQATRQCSGAHACFSSAATSPATGPRRTGQHSGRGALCSSACHPSALQPACNVLELNDQCHSEFLGVYEATCT